MTGSSCSQPLHMPYTCILPLMFSELTLAQNPTATPPKIETSLFSDTDDAYRWNHVSVIGEHDGFYGKNNVVPP